MPALPRFPLPPARTLPPARPPAAPSCLPPRAPGVGSPRMHFTLMRAKARAACAAWATSSFAAKGIALFGDSALRRPLARQHLERQVASPAALHCQREPQAEQRVHRPDLVVVAQPDRPQPDVGD